MVNILGLSFYYHDSAAALVKDGVLVAAAEEERFSRKKHDSGFPSLAIDFCLKTGGISIHDVDYVVFYEKPFVKIERMLLTAMATFPKSAAVFRESMQRWISDKLWIKSMMSKELGIPGAQKLLFADHHVSHAAASFFTSPFEESAILTVDGAGEWTTSTMGDRPRQRRSRSSRRCASRTPSACCTPRSRPTAASRSTRASTS
jgi:carbamoyltransferase